MKQDIRQKQLEGLLRLPHNEIDKEALMWQTLQFKNFMEEKYSIMPSRDHMRYSEWHFDMNTLRGACMIYREMFGTDVLEDYTNLMQCDTEKIERKS